MSKIIASSAIRGAHQIVREAEDYVARAIAAKGAIVPLGFPIPPIPCRSSTRCWASGSTAWRT